MGNFITYLKKLRRGSKSLRTLSHLGYFFDWNKSLRDNGSPLKDESPWITFSSRDKLKSLLKPDFKVFEFGGGGSSVFFSKYVKEVYTVEHDEEWLNLVVKKMKELNRKNWEGIGIPPEDSQVKSDDYSNPDLFLSADERYKYKSFKKYCTYIDKFPDEYFDVVFIDGRARPSCIKRSINKVKKNGFMIIDNSERDYYLEKIDLAKQGFTVFFNDYGPGPYVNEFWQTTIWKKKNV